MFNAFQIKNIEDYITDETVLVGDADGVCFMPAQTIDEMYIEVRNLISGDIDELKNITEFKGQTKAIAHDSWLGSLNITREAEGLEPFKVEDFEVTPKIRGKLKLSIATDNVDRHIKQICDKVQIPIERTILLLGGKGNFRLDLPLPERYKSGRKRDLTPTRLNEVRQHLIDNYNVELVDGIEADDRLEMYGFKGYLDYLKTGKFSYVVASNDKDARSTPSLLFDWARVDGNFKEQYPWLIKDSSKSVGACEFIKGKGKYIGFVNYCYQMLNGDDTDTYFPRKHLGRLPKDQQMGEAAFYKGLVACETPKDLLQFVVDTYVSWFPVGNQYTDWQGVEHKLTTLEWMEVMWQCVYMKRFENDPTTFKMLLDKYKVDYSQSVKFAEENTN